MTEAITTVRVDDETQLCVEAIGDRNEPALLLIGGATWSMDWWDDELCRRIADRGRLVVRYDNRDTGSSTSYPPGSPGYSAADLVTDAVAVLDGLEIDRAHVAELSMGGGIAQRLAVEGRNRVATLTLISTSPIDPGIDGLPGPTPEIQATFSDDALSPTGVTATPSSTTSWRVSVPTRGQATSTSRGCAPLQGMCSTAPTTWRRA